VFREQSLTRFVAVAKSIGRVIPGVAAAHRKSSTQRTIVGDDKLLVFARKFRRHLCITIAGISKARSPGWIPGIHPWKGSWTTSQRCCLIEVYLYKTSQ
jgi:hypothetical protein